MEFKFKWEVVASNVVYSFIKYGNKMLAFQVEMIIDFTSDLHVANLIYKGEKIRLDGYFTNKEAVAKRVSNIIKFFDISRLDY